VCPTLLVVDCVDQWLHSVIWLMKYDTQRMKLHWPHTDRYSTCVNREQLTLRRYQTCKRQATNETRKEGLKSYAKGQYMLYACQARLELTIGHHKLPTCTTMTSLTLSNFCYMYLVLSLVAKLHATCLLSPHNVLLSPSYMYMNRCRPALASSINRHGSSSGGNAE